jgi:poly-beta-1,6-N-acetyl-D-glucosamine synthase
MQARTNEAPGLVLGYAPNTVAPTAWNHWARFETTYVAMQYLSTAHWRWPFMGVGRNLAWHRRLFLESGGFERHRHIASGDDDLFVHQTGNRHNTAYCDHPDTFMFSAAKPNLASWLRQKNRHLTAGLAYSFWQRMVLGGAAFTHAGHYGFGVLLLLSQPAMAGQLALGYALRLAVVWVVYAAAFRRLRERGLTRLAPLLDVALALWLGAVAPALLVFGKRGRW